MCDSGYSALAGTNKCVRTCPVGPDPANPLYYEDGPVCWPFCLNDGYEFGADSGPACIKSISNRALNGNVVNSVNGGSFAPQCPPNYTGFAAQTVGTRYTTVTPIYEAGWDNTKDAGGGILMYNCYENCPTGLVNDAQGNCHLPCTFLDGTHDLCCQTSVCPLNQGEEYIGLSVQYPTVDTYFTPATTTNDSINVYGYVGNYGFDPIATPPGVDAPRDRKSTRLNSSHP